jgi:type IV pilus assembly protein PilA
MKKKGFTLIEVLIVIGVIAILAAIIIIAINPARQFAQARNTQRRNDVLAILNSVHQRMTDNRGTFNEGTTCDALPSAASIITSTVAAGNVDLCDCLVSDYVAEMPYDPSDASASYTDCADYTTGYTIIEDATTGRVTVSAPSAELGETISVTR